jgi:hypothetical protein
LTCHQRPVSNAAGSRACARVGASQNITATSEQQSAFEPKHYQHCAVTTQVKTTSRMGATVLSVLRTAAGAHKHATPYSDSMCWPTYQHGMQCMRRGIALCAYRSSRSTHRQRQMRLRVTDPRGWQNTVKGSHVCVSALRNHGVRSEGHV